MNFIIILNVVGFIVIIFATFTVSSVSNRSPKENMVTFLKRVLGILFIVTVGTIFAFFIDWLF